MKYLEIQFWKWAKWIIKQRYGANCESADYEEFENHPRELNHQGRCAGCQAKEVCEWIDGHIDLLNF